jgi:N-acetylglutamate synthase-like GNAT family acetyltransferase
MYEGTRSANANDVGSIEQLLRPLEEMGVLIHRSREQVNFTTIKSLSHFFVSILLTAVH